MIVTGGAGEPRRTQAPDQVALLLRDLVHERTGTFFENDRIDSMMEKLEPRVQATRSRSYLDYYYILKYDEKGPVEWHRVLDAFSVQETYFWREFDQVRVLVEHIVPAWFQRTTEPFRIWSGACATGEEPYSIAIALKEGGWGQHPIEIIASDASENALARARAHVYRERSFRNLSLPLREKYFENRPEGFLLDPDIARRVSFHWANLMDLDQPAGTERLNAIFCRNVFIYFSPTAIQHVIKGFARRLAPGSPLFVGASESLLKLTTDFDLEEVGGAFQYTRVRPA